MKHIEDSLLNYVLGQLQSEQFIDEVLNSANQHLMELSNRPKPDVKAIQQEFLGGICQAKDR